MERGITPINEQFLHTFVQLKSYIPHIIKTRAKFWVFLLFVLNKEFKQNNVHLYLQNAKLYNAIKNAKLYNAIKEANNSVTIVT